MTGLRLWIMNMWRVYIQTLLLAKLYIHVLRLYDPKKKKTIIKKNNKKKITITLWTRTRTRTCTRKKNYTTQKLHKIKNYTPQKLHTKIFNVRTQYLFVLYNIIYFFFGFHKSSSAERTLRTDKTRHLDILNRLMEIPVSQPQILIDQNSSSWHSRIFLLPPQTTSKITYWNPFTNTLNLSISPIKFLNTYTIYIIRE